jgi:hypothetical protein
LVELELPELPVSLDPRVRLAHWRGDEGGVPRSPLPSHTREASVLQHANVLGDRGQAHVEADRQLADGLGAGRETHEDRAPRGVSEPVEGCVEPVLVNHMV